MRRRGFSLIEIMMVLVIMATLAAIAVPRYASGAARYRVEAAARRVQVELARAQSLANMSSAPVLVIIDLQRETISVQEDAGTGSVLDLSDPPYGVDLVSSTLTDHRIRFSGFGTPDGGGELLLRAGSASARVVVDGGSGEASVP